MKTKFVDNKYNIIFIIESILFFILCLFFVPVSDDLFFAYNYSYDGLGGLIHQVLYYGNGRLIANFIGMFFAKHIMFFYPIEALLVVLFAVLVEKLIGLKNSKILVLAFIAAIPLRQFKELFAWMCAFINYFMPILFLVITLLMIKKNLCQKHKIYYAVLFVLGFCEQLFVEHSTIINILLAMTLLIYCFVKNKSYSKPIAALLLSNILGAVVMFTYKYYIDYSKTHVSQYSPNYRKTVFTYFENDGIKAALRFMMQETKTFTLIIITSVLLISILLIVMFCIEKKAEKKEIKHISFFIATGISYGVLLIITEYNFIVFDNDIPKSNKLFMAVLVFFIILTFTLMAVLFYKTIIKRMNKKQILTIFILLFFAVLSFSPFLFVFPYGYRCAFLSIFFIMIALLYIIKFAKDEYNFNIEKLYNTVFIIAGIVMIIYTGLYAREKKIFNYKIEYHKTSYYLPAADENIVFIDNNEFFDHHSGITHKYIPLEEFESILAANNQ